MRVHCLGTTGYHPSPTRHTACYYLPEFSIVFDAGTGMFRLIEQLLKDPRPTLDVFLSHAHLDHIVGLTFLLDVLAVTDLQKIRVIGEAAKLEAVRTHLYSGLIFPVDPPMEFIPLTNQTGTFQLDRQAHAPDQMPAQVHYFPLEHPGGSLGFVVEAAERRIAYVTDTVARPESDYLRHINGVDLLLHECYFGNEHQELAVKTGHSWLDAVTDVVRRVKPRRTALIHLNPLAEILGNGYQLDDEQRRLGMFVPDDEQAIEVN